MYRIYTGIANWNLRIRRPLFLLYHRSRSQIRRASIRNARKRRKKEEVHHFSSLHLPRSRIRKSERMSRSSFCCEREPSPPHTLFLPPLANNPSSSFPVLPAREEERIPLTLLRATRRGRGMLGAVGSLKGGGETDCPKSKGDQDILIESL